MAIIKKIINWLKKIIWLIISCLKEAFFGKKKVSKKIKSEITNAKNKRYLKGYGAFVEDSFSEMLPIYLLISEEQKSLLIEKVKVIEQDLLKIDNIDQKVISTKLNVITKQIEKSKISFYQKEKIEKELDTLSNDHEISVDTDRKLDILKNNIDEIVKNFDKNVKEKVVKEYKKINYITISNVLIDETIEEVKKLEENYHAHRFNRLYYNREIDKIKRRINELRKLRNSNKIREEVSLLKKEIYTKSKDKYDLLYNDEVFINLDKSCDEILERVNRKVIDIKKPPKEIKKERQDKKEQKEEKKKEEDNLWRENILKRYQDLELASQLIFLSKKKDVSFQNVNGLFSYMNQMYFDFINGEKVIFNFERNKTRFELVKLYNSLGFLGAMLTKQEFVFKEHINYKLEDLIDETANKKAEVESFLTEKFNYNSEKHEQSILVNNKLDILREKEMERKKENGSLTLIKKREENSSLKKTSK